MNVTLHLGDCLEYMRQMPDGCVDAVITDPPYGINVAEWDAVAPYDILPELLRVSRGLVLWFGAASQLQSDPQRFPVIPDRVLIWHITFALSPHGHHNHIYYRYAPIYAWRLPTRQMGLSQDVISVPQDGHNGWFHPGTKPLALMRRLVRMVEPGALILDPFLGSGTTAVAALLEGRDVIGCEIDPGYFAIAQRRIADAQAQLPLPFDPPSNPWQTPTLLDP